MKIIYKNIKIIIIGIIIIASASYIYYSVTSYREIMNNGRITIAKVTDFKRNFRNGYTVYYEYKVEDVLYEAKMHESQNHNNIVRYRFFARYNPKKPKHCTILLDKPALSKFWDPPFKGWEKIPE